jgi:hypothetical protein
MGLSGMSFAYLNRMIASSQSTCIEHDNRDKREQGPLWPLRSLNPSSRDSAIAFSASDTALQPSNDKSVSGAGTNGRRSQW